MPTKQASRRCAKCKKRYEPAAEVASEVAPAYMVATNSEQLCPKCKRKRSADIVNNALRGNVEKLCMLAGKRNG